MDNELFTGLKLDMDCFFWKVKLVMDNGLFVDFSYYLIFRFDKELNKEVAIKVIDLEES